MEFSLSAAIDYISLINSLFEKSEMTLPNLLLLINLGCEMLYIIDQRLQAQRVAKDKSAQGRRRKFYFCLENYDF